MLIQSGAGEAAGFPIRCTPKKTPGSSPGRDELFAGADVILQVRVRRGQCRKPAVPTCRDSARAK